MMTSEKMNEILERLGSAHRVKPHEPIDRGISALLEAIPDYIDRKVAEVIDGRPTD